MGVRARLIYLWAISGVLGLIGQALWRLTPIAWEAVTSGTMSPTEWIVCLVWVIVNAYSEGYVGFHRKFSPRVARRAMALARAPSWLRVVLGAPYAMGLFAADRRTKIVGWSVTALVAIAIVLVRRLAQPLRGIVDAGVVVGLAIGMVSLVVHAVRVWGTSKNGIEHPETARIGERVDSVDRPGAVP